VLLPLPPQAVATMAVAASPAATFERVPIVVSKRRESAPGAVKLGLSSAMWNTRRHRGGQS
jgi:hypothetical protein